MEMQTPTPTEPYFVDLDFINDEDKRLSTSDTEYNYAKMLLEECKKFSDLELSPRVVFNPTTGKYSVTSFESIWGQYH